MFAFSLLLSFSLSRGFQAALIFHETSSFGIPGRMRPILLSLGLVGWSVSTQWDGHWLINCVILLSFQHLCHDFFFSSSSNNDISLSLTPSGHPQSHPRQEQVTFFILFGIILVFVFTFPASSLCLYLYLSLPSSIIFVFVC